MMNKVFTQNGWEDYVYWETEDKKTLKKINALIYAGMAIRGSVNRNP